MGLQVTEFLRLRILYLRIRDSGTPNCLRGHGPLHVDSRTVCAGRQFCRQNARAGVSFVRIQRIHRTSDPSHAEQFCIRFCPVALLSGTQYYGVAGDTILQPNVRPLSCRTVLHSSLSCSLERNIMGLLVTEFLWLWILHLRIRDSGAPNCHGGHGPLRADSRTVCAVQKFCRQNARAGVPFLRMQRFHRTSDPFQSKQFCIRSCPVALLSGTQYFGVAGDRIPLAADSAPADP